MTTNTMPIFDPDKGQPDMPPDLSNINPGFRKEWAKWLRAKRHRQGHGYLNRKGKFCCLGVACQIGVRDGILKRKNYYDSAAFVEYMGKDETDWHEHGDAYLPPDAFKTWTGMTQEQAEYFASLNDDYHYTFAAIADLIDPPVPS